MVLVSSPVKYCVKEGRYFHVSDNTACSYPAVGRAPYLSKALTCLKDQINFYAALKGSFECSQVLLISSHKCLAISLCLTISATKSEE